MTPPPPPSVRKGFMKGEALRLLRTNFSKTPFEENIRDLKSRLHIRGIPRSSLVNKVLAGVQFTDGKSALHQKQKMRKKMLPFVTQYNPSVPNLKNILISKWHLSENQPLLKEIYQDPPIISYMYKRGKSLKDILVLSQTLKV